MSVLSGVPHCHARRGTFLPLQQNVPNCNSNLFARKTFSKFPHNCDFVQQHKINNFFTQMFIILPQWCNSGPKQINFFIYWTLVWSLPCHQSVTSRLETSRYRDFSQFFESIGLGLENFGLEKKSRYRSRKYLVSKKSLGIGLENI